MKIPINSFSVMEESSINHQNGGQMGPQGTAIPNNKQNEDSNPKAQYSIPGILHFIQHEWARFELERSQWEVDKAELQVIVFNNMSLQLMLTIIRLTSWD